MKALRAWSEPLSHGLRRTVSSLTPSRAGSQVLASTTQPEFEFRTTNFQGDPSGHMQATRPHTASTTLAVESQLFDTFSRGTARARFQAELDSANPNADAAYALVYVSKAVGETTAHEQIRALKRAGALRNFESGVKCVLLTQDGMFCQWLQGDINAVERTWARIKKDARHDGAMTLFRGLAPPAMLDAWSMGLRSLYMGQGDAFERARRIAFAGRDQPFRTPFDAFMSFAGVTELGHTSAGGASPVRENEFDQHVVLIGMRSAAGAQVLTEAAKGERTALGITRWGSVIDHSCDLQTVSGVLHLRNMPTYVACVSVRALRVAAVREAVRHRRRFVVTLERDDIAELEHVLTQLELNTPPDFTPIGLAVVAPAWGADTRAHAEHLLKIRAWPGQIHAADLRKRGAWKVLAELAPA